MNKKIKVTKWFTKYCKPKLKYLWCELIVSNWCNIYSIKFKQTKFAYLSFMIDACIGLIFGYSTSPINDVMIYKDAIKYYDKRRDFKSQIIAHSDYGKQYTSHFAKNYTKDNNIIISLTKPENSLGNAMCGAFLSSLKSKIPELLKQSDFKIISQMIEDYIYCYNYKRIMIKNKVLLA